METQIVKIISSGSHANAVLYHGCILVDCGAPFSALKEHIKYIQLVLLTHEHTDHFYISTILKLASMRPTIRFGCNKHLAEMLLPFKNVDVYDSGKWYDYGKFKISTFNLYHDVENIGYRIDYGGHKTIHATDTFTLEGITAKNYDLFALESNYDEETVWDRINEIESKGGFAHQRGAINSHLSEQQARNFFFENKHENSQLIRLHESKHI